MITVGTKGIEWEDPPRGYYLTDVKQKVIWRDNETGAMMALLKFPMGVADRIHSHPDANQLLYCIKGEVKSPQGVKTTMDGVSTYTPKGEKHGASNCSKETILLLYWDGPQTIQI